MPSRPRPLMREISVAALLIPAALISVTMIHRSEPGSPQSLAFALLPVPFFGFAFWTLFRSARRCDEMMQRIQFEALAFAFPLAMILAITMHLLQRAGAAIKFDLADLFIAMGILYLTGVLAARQRYR